jgi:hypothetical protein
VSSDKRGPLYRQVSMRLWSDVRFLACSDRGKLLWLFFLTAPALPIPGVMIGGEATNAEQLGWSIEEFREGLAEVTKVGLEVRREGRLVWLVNSFKHQPPTSPNQLKNWARFWDDIPDGALKLAIWNSLQFASKRWSKAFPGYFARPTGRATPSPCPSPPPRPWRHDHDHQQDHDHDQDHQQDHDLGGEAPPPPDEPVGWSPDPSTPGLDVALKRAEQLRIDVPTTLAKFRVAVLEQGLTHRQLDAKWVKWLCSEYSPPEHELAARDAAEKRERAAKRREQLELTDQTRRGPLALVPDEPPLEPGAAAAAYEEAQRLMRGGGAA